MQRARCWGKSEGHNLSLRSRAGWWGTTGQTGRDGEGGKYSSACVPLGRGCFEGWSQQLGSHWRNRSGSWGRRCWNMRCILELYLPTKRGGDRVEPCTGGAESWSLLFMLHREKRTPSVALAATTKRPRQALQDYCLLGWCSSTFIF